MALHAALHRPPWQSRRIHWPPPHAHHEITGSKPAGLRLERIRSSRLWSGDAFRNLHPIADGLRDPAAPRPTLAEFLCGGNRRVPIGPLPSMSPREVWQRKPQSGLRATWLGHSTVLIEIDGLRVLTDPVWGPRASPSRVAGPASVSSRCRCA